MSGYIQKLRALSAVVACGGLTAFSQGASAGTITAFFTGSDPNPHGCGPADITGRCTNSGDHSTVAGVEEIDFETPNLVTLNGNHAINIPGMLTASGGTVVHFTPSGGGASIQPGQLHSDTVGIAAAPWNDYTQFLSTPSSLGGDTGAVDVTFGRDLNYLGFDWGSIDTYNSITFVSHGFALHTFAGGDVVGFNANGAQMSNFSNGFVDFYLSGMTFDEIVLTSNGRAFELDNLAFGPASVPAPLSLLLLGSGLLGLGVTRRRKAS